MPLASFIACAAAMADQTRLRMLLQLGGGPRFVGQLASRVGVSSSAATYHIKLMREAGLVVTERRGRCTIVRRHEPRWQGIVRALAAGV
jgi:DNA-binding transcriptional ArsR family regulator